MVTSSKAFFNEREDEGLENLVRCLGGARGRVFASVGEGIEYFLFEDLHEGEDVWKVEGQARLPDVVWVRQSTKHKILIEDSDPRRSTEEFVPESIFRCGFRHARLEG